jgi:signal transduction histidine kinase
MAEAEELRETVIALRDRLEAESEARRTEAQEVERLHRAELEELRATIRSLREQLEGAADG